MTTSEERALFKYVSRNITRCCPNVPRNRAEFVIPDELNQTITEHGDVGDSDFLINNSTTGEDARPHHHFLIMRHATTRCNLERIVCRRYISNDFQPLLVSLHDTRRRRLNSVSDLFHSQGKRTENNVHEGVRVHKTVLTIIQ